MVLSNHKEQKAHSSTGLERPFTLNTDQSKNSNGETYSKFWNSSALLDQSQGLKQEVAHETYRYSLPGQANTSYSIQNSGMFFATDRKYESSSKGGEILPNQYTIGAERRPMTMEGTPALPTLTIRLPGQSDGRDPLRTHQVARPMYEGGLPYSGQSSMHYQQSSGLERGDTLESRKIGDSFIIAKPVDSPKNNISSKNAQVQQLFDSIKHSNQDQTPSQFFNSITGSFHNQTEVLKPMTTYLKPENGLFLAPHH